MAREGGGGEEEREGTDEEHGRTRSRGRGGSGDGDGGSSGSVDGLTGAAGGVTPAGAVLVEDDAGFDFFLNGWGFCCPSSEVFSCCCGDSRRAALLSIKPSKELRAVRLIQLLKYADPRANAYLNDPAGQGLLSSIEFRQVLHVHTPLRVGRPFPSAPPPAAAVVAPS